MLENVTTHYHKCNVLLQLAVQSCWNQFKLEPSGGRTVPTNRNILDILQFVLSTFTQFALTYLECWKVLRSWQKAAVFMRVQFAASDLSELSVYSGVALQQLVVWCRFNVLGWIFFSHLVPCDKGVTALLCSLGGLHQLLCLFSPLTVQSKCCFGRSPLVWCQIPDRC